MHLDYVWLGLMSDQVGLCRPPVSQPYAPDDSIHPCIVLNPAPDDLLHHELDSWMTVANQALQMLDEVEVHVK